MGGLLGELGKKLAEQWLTLLVLPGALYLAVVAAGHTLGHGAALDVGRLTQAVSAAARDPQVTTVGGQVVLLTAVLAGAAAAGLAAQALGSAVERAALAAGWAAWPWPFGELAERRTAHRRRRWDALRAAYEVLLTQERAPRPADRPSPLERHRAARRCERVSVERPERPTWSGDRIHAAAVRLDRDTHISLLVVWPHLWLVLPEETRLEIGRARAALTRAAVLGGWALLYLPLTWWWWPAAPLAATLVTISARRLRTASDTYATLLEASARLHLTDLAVKLNIGELPVGPRLGAALMRQLSSPVPRPDPAP
ncbi:hypothetical protein EJ357_21715 [Streptomyces cyaneochromogenes]|uniref:Uncharacterized protein n=1 Tax=Streptomyces cyaneochromogenes TaxID=2496836 RepID=A0A3Q9ETS7_9ACTN|nr:hypothetical protein [Streptomyces cyaneochromogenes]AZQ35792.1 hypothetical protein EJ357_21715 [Streptomyces cyaneochromogenes]